MQTNFNIQELKEISLSLETIINELQKQKQKVDKKIAVKTLLEKMKKW